MPLTANEVNVPTEVMLGCAAVVNVPVSSDAPTVPELAYTLPAITFPVTVALVRVPVLVIFG